MRAGKPEEPEGARMTDTVESAGRDMARRSIFPPRPCDMKGRSAEVDTLERTILATRPTRIALVGAGGSGKSMLAAELGHRLRGAFDGRVDWFRSGAWGFHTLTEMLALRFGTGR